VLTLLLLITILDPLEVIEAGCQVLCSLTEDFEGAVEVLQRSRGCRVAGLEPETLYHVDVRAQNAQGWGPRSGGPVAVRTSAAPVQHFILPKRPDAPRAELAEDKDGRAVSVSWTCPEPSDPRRRARDPAAQAQMIASYSVNLVGRDTSTSQSAQSGAVSVDFREGILQARDDSGAPRNASNAVVFAGLSPGRWYRAHVQAFGQSSPIEKANIIICSKWRKKHDMESSRMRLHDGSDIMRAGIQRGWAVGLVAAVGRAARAARAARGRAGRRLRRVHAPDARGRVVRARRQRRWIDKQCDDIPMDR